MDLHQNNNQKKTKRKKVINNRKACFFIFLITIGCQNTNQKSTEFPFQNIDEKNTEIITSEDKSKEIDMAHLTPFIWDELFIFNPYTPIFKINNDLGFFWEEAEKTFINQEEEFDLLVFTKDNSVVGYIKWPRSKGDFSKIETRKYPYESARFIFKKEKFGGQDWVFLYEKENDDNSN